MPRYKLTVAYDGTLFHGWQKQGTGEGRPPIAIGGLRPNDEIRTVQAALEEAVRRVVREPIELIGASRTDAGVHARGQVAAFSTQGEIAVPLAKLHRAINSRLPDDVQVSNAMIVADDFDPITHAIAKGYRYRIAYGCDRRRPPLFDRHFVTAVRSDLDPARMQVAARFFVGEHDFTSFARMNHGRESAVRTIHECTVTAIGRRRCHIDISGNGFLYNMVRIIAGTLVEVGRGRMKPDSIPGILAAKNRETAGPTLGPEGLCLMWIKYKS